MTLTVNFNTIAYRCKPTILKQRLAFIERTEEVCNKRWTHKTPICAVSDRSVSEEEINRNNNDKRMENHNESVNSTDGNETKERPHNRLTNIYSQMKQVCPDDIKAYAVCIQHANDDDEIGLTKGCCESEFQKVKDCFSRVRYQKM